MEQKQPTTEYLARACDAALQLAEQRFPLLHNRGRALATGVAADIDSLLLLDLNDEYDKEAGVALVLLLDDPDGQPDNAITWAVRVLAEWLQYGRFYACTDE
jgi:hypothetical protein